MINILVSDLALIERSEMFRGSYGLPERRKPSSYGLIFLVSSKYSDYWYCELVGMQFFCELVFIRGKLYSVHPVRLTKTQKIKGQGFHLDDIILI